MLCVPFTFQQPTRLKTQCGWQTSSGGLLTLVKPTAGGGKRWKSFSKEATYAEVLVQLKEEFGLVDDDSARLTSYDGTPVPKDVTFGHYVKHILKPKSYPRLYIVTQKEKE